MPLALYSLVVLGFLGTGLASFGRRFLDRSPGAAELFVGLVIGIAVSHLVVYAGASLAFSLAAVLVVGVPFASLVAVRRLRRGEGFLPTFPYRALVLGLLAFPIFLRIVGEPVIDWDARSIWFFHAKILFHDGRLLAHAWTKPELLFAHPNYPKLVPLLAAQCATLVGYWNDFWPKLSLLTLLGLTQVGVYALPVPTWLAVPVSALLVYGNDRLMWSGYMDGYLAIFAFLGVTFLTLFVHERHAKWLAPALAALAVTMQLKEEGVMLTAIALAIAVLMLASRRALGEAARKLAAPSLVPFLAWGAWIAFRTSHHLTNYFARHFERGRVLARFVQPEFWREVFSYYLFDTPLRVALPALAGYLLLRKALGRRSAWREGYLPLAVFVLYTGFLVFTFLATPFDVPGHLSVAMDRLARALVGLLLSAAILLSMPRRGPAAPLQNLRFESR